MAKKHRDTLKRRHTKLKLNYLQGLELEYNKNLNNFKSIQTAEVNRYFDEDTQLVRKRLEGTHQDTEIKTKKLVAYDKKHYWKRRRFKTKYKNNLQLPVLLEAYDISAAENRTVYMTSLDMKHPATPYDTKQVSKFKEVLNKHAQKKSIRLEKMMLRYETLKAKTSKVMDKLKNKQSIYEALIIKFNESIKIYNESTIAVEKEKLTHINQKLENLQLSEKEKNKLLDKQTILENKINIQSDDQIQLSIRGLKMYFGGIKAINDLSFEVKKGEIFGLIGPNGAGKTTVFNCITQFYKSTGGSIHFRNKENDIVDLNQLETHDMIHEGVARSFQNVELIWELTVLDNLLVAGHSLLITDYLEHMIHSKRTKREEAVLRSKGYQILKDLNIESYAFRSPYGLPYGVLKKIELARTLMTNPSLIILDEPAAGLNDQETIDLANVIKEINQKYGVTIFLVEHDMGLVMSICERVCAISFGKKLALDTARAIQHNHDVRVAYLGEEDDE